MQEKSLKILLIPGFMLNASLWDKVKGFLPTIYDIDCVSHLHGPNIDEIAQSIMKDRPAQYVVIGFSLGAYIARSIAEQFPAQVKALIVIASSLRADTIAQQHQKLHAVQLYNQHNFRGLSTGSIAKTLHPQSNQNKELIQTIQNMGLQLGYQVFAQQSILQRYPPQKTLNFPTLVIAAKNDQLRSAEEALELKQYLSAKLVYIKNSGHMIPLEQPKALAQTIASWLSHQKWG
ncbi:alpha/beta fold hydrolase [Acinetobacter larvae]|uniref:Alpha/beta hydrolase n=1 Tax=Acinetobacter larvae TaxID=1789224 RepID=A0A1B2LZP6_9GAMM|nr:alpha/beta hydrolase [Acinetobacter larvae]AOA58381.1 alpha/beta hydrolase [Acinetobacter larvae]